MHSKFKVIWIDLIGCNGCSYSFFNYPYMKELFEKIEFLYHPLIDTEELKIQECDLLVVEGAIKNEEKYGFNIIELLSKLFTKSKKVLALGTCAVYGGLFGKGVMYFKDKKVNFFQCKDKIINLPGCPPHYDWIVYVLEALAENKDILLDSKNRPKEIFAFTSHSGCSRNEYFEWKIDAKDFGEKEGCLFYIQGCQGPFTHSSCNRILWNEVNSKPRAGTPCFGCTEENFPREGLFETETFMGIPAQIPLGVSKRAYLTLAGVAKSLKNERLSQKIIGCRDDEEVNNEN